MKHNYTYIKKSDLDDTELLPYDVSSSINERRILGKKNHEYKSLEWLDISISTFPSIQNGAVYQRLAYYISICDEKYLKNTMQVSENIEKYLSLEKFSFIFKNVIKVFLFKNTVKIFLKGNIKCPTAWDKLIQYVKNNYETIVEFALTVMDSEHLDFFLKHWRLGGHRFITRTVYPLFLIVSHGAKDQLYVFLQHTNCLQDDPERLIDYFLDRNVSLSDDLPPHYSIEKFSLILLLYDFPCEDTTPTMTLVWRSVPYAYPTTNEVKDILRRIFPKEERRILKTCEKYNQIFIFPTSRPRSLKHLARTAIRKFYQVSEFYNKLNIPPTIRSYLKLDY